MSAMIRNYCIYFTLSFFLLGCKPSYTKNQTILNAEKVLFSSPDSAYKLLKSINHPEKLSEADYAAWCLHYVHARFKLFLTEKNDKLLLEKAFKYYKKNGNNKFIGTAIYLKGGIAESEQKVNLAMKYFKQAVRILEKTADIQLIGIIYTKIGYLYICDELYNESIKNLDIGLKYLIKSNNINFIGYCYRLKAECFYRLQKPMNQILELSELSKKYISQTTDSILYYDIILFEGKINIDNDNLSAKKSLLTVFKNKKYQNKNTALLLAYTYALLSNPDSAKYYLSINKLDSSDINMVLINDITMSSLHFELKDYLSAYKHYKNAYTSREKQYAKTSKTLLLNIDKQFDYSQKEQERAKLEIANQQKIILIIILFVLILIGVIIQLQISNRNKLKQKKMELEQQQMQFKIINKELENAQNIAFIQANIQNKIENTLKFKKLNTGTTNKEKIDSFLSEIALQSVVSENELLFYMNEADKLFGKRISALKSKFPKLTSSDLIVISLMCLGINYNDCAHLLNISINTLYTRRKRIKSHMDFDKNVDLEEWIVMNVTKQE